MAENIPGTLAEIIVDTSGRDVIEVIVIADGAELARRTLEYSEAVDNKLLTAIDNLFKEHILDKFVSFSVKPGQGVDKTSLLYRMIITLGAALQRA